MSIESSSYLNAIASYDKVVDNVGKAEKTLDIANQFQNVMAQSVNIANNVSTRNDGVIKWLGDAIVDARSKIVRSENVSKKTLVKEASLTDMVTALSEAELTIQSVVNIRDKAIAAYQDLIKMQI